MNRFIDDEAEVDEDEDEEEDADEYARGAWTLAIMLTLH